MLLTKFCFVYFIEAIRKRFAEATDKEINKSLSLYLAGAADREGGRKNRGGTLVG